MTATTGSRPARPGSKRQRVMGLVFVCLGVLTGLEYVIGVRYRHTLLLILPIVLAMGVLMLRNVMRIGELRDREAGRAER